MNRRIGLIAAALAALTAVPPVAALAAPEPAAALAAPGRAAAGSYVMVDLGKLGRNAAATSINARSEVVGEFFGTTGWGAFLWSPRRTGGVLTELTGLPCPGCASVSVRAAAVNDRGDIAGDATAPDGQHAVMWVDGALLDLGRFGENTRVTAMNSRREVVGYGLTVAGEWHAFVWSPAGGMRDISPGMAWAHAYDINDRGQIVGDCGTGSATARACLWERDGTVRTVAAPAGESAVARAINNRGVVVGSYGDAPRHAVAFRWSSGVLTALTGPADESAIATGINEAGTVVGYWYLPSPVGPWVWDDGVLTDLPASASGTRQGPAAPAAIGRSGVIAGRSGTADDPWFHAVLWQRQ